MVVHMPALAGTAAASEAKSESVKTRYFIVVYPLGLAAKIRATGASADWAGLCRHSDSERGENRQCQKRIFHNRSFVIGVIAVHAVR
jgi:hypothetical protein